MSNLLNDLVFDHRAIVTLWRKHKINLNAITREELVNPDVMEKLIWAGNLHSQPKLSLPSVGDAIADMRPKEYVPIVTDALIESLGDPPEEELEPQDEQPGREEDVASDPYVTLDYPEPGDS